MGCTNQATLAGPKDGQIRVSSTVYRVLQIGGKCKCRALETVAFVF